MNMNNLWGFLPFTWEHLVVFSPQILNRTTFLWFCSLKPFFGSKSSGFYWAPSGLDTAGILSGLTAMLLWKILLLKLGGMVLSSTHSGMVPLSTFLTSTILSFCHWFSFLLGCEIISVRNYSKIFNSFPQWWWPFGPPFLLDGLLWGVWKEM